MPTPDDYADEIAMGATPWQIALLNLNPPYVGWNPGDDSMKNGGTCSWADFSERWPLDDLNEVVNFHFQVTRKSENCAACGATGTSPGARTVEHLFYHGDLGLKTYTGGWNDKITEDEYQALLAEGRIQGRTEGALPTVEEVNRLQAAANVGGHFGYHDAINRFILVHARCKRLGIEPKCAECAGRGYHYTAPDTHVVLSLWMLYPRKGLSQGLRIEPIEEGDQEAVFRFLRAAAARNAMRFEKIPAPPESNTPPTAG